MHIMVKIVISECEDEELEDDNGKTESCKEYVESYCKNGLIKSTAWQVVKRKNLQGKCCACGKMGKSMWNIIIFFQFIYL